jgi:hypothetical protein
MLGIPDSEASTDDRGIYRIYGLPAGGYQVCAGGRNFSAFSSPGAYDTDAPTFYPSGTVDIATEITVRPGEEITGIDIRYRSLPGQVISGRVSQPAGVGRSDRVGTTVTLFRASNEVIEDSTSTMFGGNEAGFVFNGVADGEYYLVAIRYMAGFQGSQPGASQPVKVSVRGEAVTGIELVVEPLSSIEGRVKVERLQPPLTASCKDAAGNTNPQEFVIEGTANEPTRADNLLATLLGESKITTANEKGEFALHSLFPGPHRVDVQPPDEHVFVKSIVRPALTPNGKPIDVGRDGVSVKAGEKILEVVVSVAEGATGVRGRVVVGPDQKPPKAPMRIYAVPAARELADDVLRYAEAEVGEDGTFSLVRLAPGSYRLIARELSDPNTETDRRPLAWSVSSRRGLLLEAEAVNKTIDLTPCQRVSGYVFRHEPLTAPSTQTKKK